MESMGRNGWMDGRTSVHESRLPVNKIASTTLSVRGHLSERAAANKYRAFLCSFSLHIFWSRSAATAAAARDDRQTEDTTETSHQLALQKYLCWLATRWRFLSNKRRRMPADSVTNGLMRSDVQQPLLERSTDSRRSGWPPCWRQPRPSSCSRTRSGSALLVGGEESDSRFMGKNSLGSEEVEWRGCISFICTLDYCIFQNYHSVYTWPDMAIVLITRIAFRLRRGAPLVLFRLVDQ